MSILFVLLMFLLCCKVVLVLVLILFFRLRFLICSSRLEAEVVAGSTTWIGKGLSCVCAQIRESDDRPSFDLTPVQEALQTLWDVSFPKEELHGLISEQWKEMGWQGKDPSTDFRGGGFISWENLLFFARTYPSFEQLNQRVVSVVVEPIQSKGKVVIDALTFDQPTNHDAWPITKANNIQSWASQQAIISSIDSWVKQALLPNSSISDYVDSSFSWE